ncbi:major capsid protein [Janthinobacterium sp. B9-8]|uniref:major capsid protein n=1 Tax=Janthinobacterium sp. B9-8 TaxID=1236179 RepID=UPI000699C6D9|nr:major capsid protein [Janthinobacterium sp. B9-8]AMC34253.1 hypothetical protein VN23_06400 [Janthinobacterium sp. B9-8]
MTKFLKRGYRVAVVVAGTLIAAPAFAAVDVSAVLAEMGEAQKAIALIGTAALSIYVGIKVYKWAKNALI